MHLNCQGNNYNYSFRIQNRKKGYNFNCWKWKYGELVKKGGNVNVCILEYWFSSDSS